ncbi:chitinase 1 [Helicostylum pulchrum]|uniref:chitinase n=1 Tax=Helicostylum pulchrum TaxID=562976 RepID=A0ABP9XM99_9FUNG|nr:chitinase 1 [Helicostylum pulchrum]
MLFRSLGFAAAALLSSVCVEAAYTANGPNILYYWGQNSAGGGNTQGTLGSYCKTGKMDGVLISFLHIFNVGGKPGMNLSNACETTFPGLQLLDCPAIGADIKVCQDLGVKVILSLGGASGSYSLANDAAGVTFANTLWDLFGGGTSDTRPFGDAVIDGIDLDIEGGPSTGYGALVTAARSKFGSNFLVGAAPQCPFPDLILGSVINSVGFDYINVQFYNNYCSASSGSFNFDTWADWAKNVSPNKNVKIMLTLPGAPTAAGSGYVPISTISTLVPTLASTYSGVYGGVAIWDASQAWANSGFADSLFTVVKGNSGNPGTKTTTVSKTTTSKTTSAAPVTSGGVSTTTTATAPTTTPTNSGNCVTKGQACSKEGQYVCTTGGAYAVCDHAVWGVTSCPSGTACIATSDGASIYCGSATGGNVCSASSPVSLLRDTLNKGAIPKPYKASQVGAQLTVISSDANGFEAVINARRLVATPFNKQVTIEFTAPANIKFTSVSSGTIRQVGTNVRIQADNEHNNSMAIVVGVKGSIGSGVFVAPNPASMRFK